LNGKTGADVKWNGHVLANATHRKTRSGPSRQANNNERTNDRNACTEHVARGWLLTFNEPQPDGRRGDVDPTVRRVGSSRGGRVDTRQCDGKADETEDAYDCDCR